jgi:hypothetical protein
VRHFTGENRIHRQATIEFVKEKYPISLGGNTLAARQIFIAVML